MEKNQTSVTRNNDMKVIVEGGIARRLLALIMDAALAVFIMIGMIAFIFTPIADKAFDYSKKMAKGTQWQIASGLFVCVDENDDGSKVVYEIDELDKKTDTADYLMITNYETDDVNFYKNHLKYYYLNYKTGVGVKTPSGGNIEDYKCPNHEKTIDGLLPIEVYTEDWFNSKFGEISTVKDIETPLLDALKDFTEQDYFVELNRNLKGIQCFLIFTPFVLSFAIFFIVIPLCFKNGETLGKKTLHIGFVTKDGYSIKKRQIVFRQILLLLYVFACSFVIGIGATSIATLGLGVLIYFIPTFISKTGRSPLDKLAYTYLIDTIKSVWFLDEFEEQRILEAHQKEMKKYRKKPVKNKNIIQVGSKIVDKELRDEIEKEKSKTNKS